MLLLASAATFAAAVGGLHWLTTGLLVAAERGGTTLDEAVGLGAVLGCWLCLSWLVLGTVFTAASALPGAVGRWSSATAEQLAPWTLRRIVVAGLGVTVVVGPGVAAAEPPQLTSAVVAHLDRPAEAGDVVTVHPGDCLWTITARDLGPLASNSDIAAAWPWWYAANRGAIGPDPNLIRPGQQLVAPR
jgi:hypothetical protein